MENETLSGLEEKWKLLVGGDRDFDATSAMNSGWSNFSAYKDDSPIQVVSSTEDLIDARLERNIRRDKPES